MLADGNHGEGGMQPVSDSGRSSETISIGGQICFFRSSQSEPKTYYPFIKFAISSAISSTVFVAVFRASLSANDGL